jgi:hypothetical protein
MFSYSQSNLIPAWEEALADLGVDTFSLTIWFNIGKNFNHLATCNPLTLIYKFNSKYTGSTEAC